MWAFVLALAMTSPLLLCLVARWLDAPSAPARRATDQPDGEADESGTDERSKFVKPS